MSDDPKQKPGQRAPAGEGLLTSEDIFGDMLDEPPAGAAPAPAPAEPPRRGPIKVQVGEPGSARKMTGTGTEGEELPEDIAALLDAFSGPAEDAARNAAPPAPEPPPVPEPPPTPRSSGSTLPTAADFGAVDDIFGALMGDEPAPAPPAPAPPAPPPPAPPPPAPPPPAPPRRVAPPPPPVIAAPPPPPPPPPARPEPELEPEPAAEDVVMELALDSEEPPATDTSLSPGTLLDDVELEAVDDGEPLLEALEDEPPLQPAHAEDRTPVSPPRVAGLTLTPTPTKRPKDDPYAELLKSLPTPTSRTGTRFAAQPAKATPPVEGGLDLAALADEAWGGGPAPAAEPPKPPPPAPPPVAPAPEPAAKAKPRHEQGFGPYLLLERIAVGGMAEVFRGKRTGVEGFEKIVAVKRILPHLADNKEFVDMFIDEAKMVAGLTHPNIVQIFDLGRLEKSYYIAMEYVHGRDLRTILRRGKDKGLKMPIDLAVLIASRVASALEYAHRARDASGRQMKIVHRDISPQNILISFEGDVKLTDFGIAKAATKATSTDRGALRGKLLYMSPEQAWGKAMDRRSDLYSLGILLYEMLTEQKPFLGTSEMSVLEMVREGKVSPPSGLNPRVHERLERVVMKALEKEPDLRYQDAAEMYRDLERVLHERQPPPSTNALTKYMELLFDGDERGAVPEPQEPRGESHPDLEMDFDTTLPGARSAGPAASEPAAAKPGEPVSLQSLLKRFGIK